MTQETSKAIISNQTGLHKNLTAVVRKHLKHTYQKPVADFSQKTFENLHSLVLKHNGPVILDSCCGTGESTRHIANSSSGHLVIGIDKSRNRLERQQDCPLPDNAITVRGDLNDLFRLIAWAKWPVSHHFILYPNPWPKSRHLGRRWHGSAVFPDILKIGQHLTLRSNWPVYLQEFQHALDMSNYPSDLAPFSPCTPITPFERKYNKSGHTLWQLTCHLARFRSNRP